MQCYLEIGDLIIKPLGIGQLEKNKGRVILRTQLSNEIPDHIKMEFI